MAGRSPARFIAPLALVAFALALFFVISSTTKDEQEATRGSDAGQSQSDGKAEKQGDGKKKKKAKKTYVVEAGDTPSGIAEKANVPLEQILELNPDLDPQSLAPGTTIRLR
jgi:LysM repeat protein